MVNYLLYHHKTLIIYAGNNINNKSLRRVFLLSIRQYMVNKVEGRRVVITQDGDDDDDGKNMV